MIGGNFEIEQSEFSNSMSFQALENWAKPKAKQVEKYQSG